MDLQERGFDTIKDKPHVLKRDGRAGNLDIVNEMVRGIRRGVAKDIGIQNEAARVLINAGLDSYASEIDQLQAIFDFVKANVHYISDEAGATESLKSARVTLRDGYGDCDDLTVTVATLAGDVGFEQINIALARFDNDSFSHVYPVVYTRDNQRIVMDASLPDGQLGDEVPATEIKEINVFGAVAGIDGISGVYNNVKREGMKLGRAALDVLPTVASYMPLGKIASETVSRATQMIGQTSDNDLSINAAGSTVNAELDKIIFDLLQSRIALDIAQAESLRIASQLGLIQHRGDKDNYQVIKASIQQRLNFIRDFESYAKANDIKVVKLNPILMLIVGGGALATVGYQFYKYAKR